MARAEVRADDGAPAGERRRRRNLSVDVCYIAIVRVLPAGGALRRADLDLVRARSARRAIRARLIVTQGGNQPVALLFAGGDGLTIGDPDRPGAAAVRRDDRGHAARGWPARRPPPALSAIAGDASASLSWTAPSFDGGSPVSGYRVYRDTSPNPTTAVATLGSADELRRLGPRRTARPTTTRCPPLNANGEGPLSNQASATPTALVAPVEPLPTVDDFDRATRTRSRTPGAGRTGSTARSRPACTTTANRLACSKTTTCTAWRNAAQYGPDVEVWARISTLPGANNQLRLLARIQQPGTSTYDGYMLRPNQLAGTDQISSSGSTTARSSTA